MFLNLLTVLEQIPILKTEITLFKFMAKMGRVLQGWMKKAKGLRSTNWLLQNSYGVVKYSIGNIVNNILITVYFVRWV